MARTTNFLFRQERRDTDASQNLTRLEWQVNQENSVLPAITCLLQTTHIAFADADLSKAGRSYNAVTLALIAGPLALFGKGKNIDVNEGTPLVMAVGADTPVVPLATIPPDQTVAIVPDKHHGKKMTGIIKAFDTDTLTVVSDGMDKVMKLKDIKQILLSDLPPEK